MSTPNLGNIIENVKRRKLAYKIVGVIGLAGTAVTAALGPFGITPEASPYLLSFWAVYGVLAAGGVGIADANAPKDL